MNDRRREDQLIAETFHGDWSSGPLAEFARTAAAQARQRRRTRRTLATGAVAVVACALFANFSLRRPPQPATDASTAVAAKPAASATRSFEVISDDELLAQLRDRPVMVVKNARGEREILILANE